MAFWGHSELSAQLTNSNLDPERVRAADVVSVALADRRQQSDLAASASLLAGLVLDKELIQRVLRTEMMRESVIYQDIKAEGRAEGEVTGRQKEASSLILRQLNRKLGNLAPEDEERLRELSIEQLETLGEELLTFSALRDLLTWLEQCS